MIYNEWLNQTNLTNFKNRVKNALNNLSYNNLLISKDAFLTTVLDAVKARYGIRRIYWQNPADFEDNFFLQMTCWIPYFASRLKKFDFFEMLHDETSFGTNRNINERTTFEHSGQDSKQVNDTDINESSSKKITNSTDRNEATSSGTNRSESSETSRNEVSENKSDKTVESGTTEHTSKTTQTDSKNNNSTNNSTNTSTQLTGGVPNMSLNADTLDTSILAYDKNVNKVTNEGTESGTESSNSTSNVTNSDTTNRTNTLTGTHSSTDAGTKTINNSGTDSQTDNSTRTINGTDTNTSTDNRTRTSNVSGTDSSTDSGTKTVTSSDLDKQIGVLNILRSQQEWQFYFAELIDNFEHLFVGVSYYEF